MSAWTAFAPAAPREHRLTLADTVFASLAVFLLIIFSQGWIMPLMGETVNASSGGIIRLIYFPAYFAGLALVLPHIPDMIRMLVRQPFLIFLCGLAAVSMLWSINPGETMRRVVALGFTTLAGVALAARYRWREMIEIMAIAFAILSVLSALVAIAVPSIGIMSTLFPGAWRGLWVEKNALGGNMAMFFPVFVAAAILVPRRRWLWIGMTLLSVALLLLSTSKTSLVALILGAMGIGFVALVQRGPAMAVVLTYLGVLAAGAVGGAFLLASDQIFELLGKDATLTGRTEIWSAIMTQIPHHPWLGHGYGTVWTDEDPRGPLAWIIKYANFRPIHAHSSWYEMALWLGIVGLVSWGLLYAQTMIAGMVAAFREKGALMAFPFLLVYSMVTITESITLTYNDLRWVVFVAVACKLAYPDRLMNRR